MQAADFLQGELQDRGDRSVLVGLARNAFQCLQFTLALIKIAQAFFGDGFGFQPCRALAFQPLAQPVEFVLKLGCAGFRRFRLRRQ